MILDYPKDFSDFELIDTGNGYRLEKWGEAILVRPDPQIIWSKTLPETEWSQGWAKFKSASGEDKGRWEIKKPVPEPWIIEYQNIKLLLKLSPFKHTGLFAEQAANWKFMIDRLDGFRLAGSQINKPKILNLFAYTGGATMALAKIGCYVTHVDASKPAIAWAKENHALNNLSGDSVRWILDDAVKFVKRELRRGATYDGIIMDPPAFGHSPSGKTWKFNQNLPGLLKDCVQLLSPEAKFLVINGYATNSSALALNNTVEDATKQLGGKIEFGELCLKQKSNRLISTGIFARWSNSI